MSSIAVDRPRPVRALTDIRPEQSKLAGRRPSSFPSASSARPRTSTIVVGKSPKAGSPTQSLTKSPTKSKQRQSSPPQYKRVVRVPSRATKRVKAFEVLTIDTAGDPTQPYTQLSRLSRADSVRPPRISPADKTSSLRGFPFSQSQFARLLCSPHRAQILRSHGYLLDKNGKLMVIKKAKNSSPLTSDLAGPVNMTSPSTPPNTIPSSGGDIDISSSAFIPRRAYGDNDSPTDTAAALAAKRRDSACVSFSLCTQFTRDVIISRLPRPIAMIFSRYQTMELVNMSSQHSASSLLCLTRHFPLCPPCMSTTLPSVEVYLVSTFRSSWLGEHFI